MNQKIIVYTSQTDKLTHSFLHKHIPYTNFQYFRKKSNKVYPHKVYLIVIYNLGRFLIKVEKEIIIKIFKN